MPTRNERLAELLRKRQLHLLRHQVSTRTELEKFLDALGKAITAGIISISPDEPVREVYRRARVEKLIEAVSARIASTYKDITKSHTQELAGLADVEAAYLLRAVNGLFDNDPVSLSLDAGHAVALVKNTLMSGAPLKDWWAGQSDAMQTRFAQTMRVGFLNHESDADLVKRVRGTAELGFKDGLMEVSRRMAKILVRGAGSSIVTAVRSKAVEDNPRIFRAVQQVSVLDGRTSPVCIACAGKVWSVPGYKPIGHSIAYNGGPPRHPNCRSTMIPVIREEHGGAPADDISFENFLTDKPASVLDDLLGKGRAQLYSDRKITLSDLVDQQGRPLTLDQLREID